MITNGQKRKRFINEVNNKTLMYEALNEGCPTIIRQVTQAEIDDYYFEEERRKHNAWNPLCNNA